MRRQKRVFDFFFLFLCNTIRIFLLLEVTMYSTLAEHLGWMKTNSTYPFPVLENKKHVYYFSSKNRLFSILLTVKCLEKKHESKENKRAAVAHCWADNISKYLAYLSSLVSQFTLPIREQQEEFLFGTSVQVTVHFSVACYILSLRQSKHKTASLKGAWHLHNTPEQRKTVKYQGL